MNIYFGDIPEGGKLHDTHIRKAEKFLDSTNFRSKGFIVSEIMLHSAREIFKFENSHRLIVKYIKIQRCIFSTYLVLITYLHRDI